MSDDPVDEGLRRLGLHVERREASPLEQMVASGLGGIAGSALAAVVGSGWLGKALLSLGGSVVGHMVVTHRVTYEPMARRDVASDAPEGPTRWSDRR